jgi:dynactin-5
MVIIKPPTKRQNKELKYIPISIGNYVYVEKGTIIEAMSIGNFVKIGKDCILGQRVVIGDNSIVLDNSIVCPDTYIAPFSVYGGKPAIYLG